MKGNVCKCLSRALVQVRVQVEMPFEAILNFRCAFVNAMSYHAESLVIEPMVQKVRKNRKACAIEMKCSTERDVKA
jgi:hypothetical protein